MVVLDLLTDVLYDHLKLVKQQAIPQRDQCDITFLYQQLYSLKIHLLSKGRYGGHWVDILPTQMFTILNECVCSETKCSTQMRFHWTTLIDWLIYCD